MQPKPNYLQFTELPKDGITKLNKVLALQVSAAFYSGKNYKLVVDLGEAATIIGLNKINLIGTPTQILKTINRFCKACKITVEDFEKANSKQAQTDAANAPD